ncbi:MAG: PIG-L family deacetylase [Opitutae bacterium]|nr:PIG-L family deacetylase [Opitutae bacterium]|tara:strand:+ start:3318 stop:4190 length:873 start_codon:yes stop_codon:yes gene_type:complete
MSENPYCAYASSFRKLVDDGVNLPLGGMPKPPTPDLFPDAPVCLIFSPHPDDECIIGGLPLRLMREAGVRVVNVAVTLGSNKERQQARLVELKDACDWIGFELQETAPNGLERIRPDARENEPDHWEAAMHTIASILADHVPQSIFIPHDADWNGTHLGVHQLVLDALASLPSDFSTILVENEFWGQMQSPNLMVESSETDVADLLAALSHHVGEVRRNPYHLRMPAWLQDNVRLGAELVGGEGGDAPAFDFATLYRVRHWQDGVVKEAWSGGRQLAARENAGILFGAAD